MRTTVSSANRSQHDSNRSIMERRPPSSPEASRKKQRSTGSDISHAGSWCHELPEPDLDLSGDLMGGHFSTNFAGRPPTVPSPPGFRLPTPDIAPLCTDIEFCLCCDAGNRDVDAINDTWALRRKSKMDSQRKSNHSGLACVVIPPI